MHDLNVMTLFILKASHQSPPLSPNGLPPCPCRLSPLDLALLGLTLPLLHRQPVKVHFLAEKPSTKGLSAELSHGEGRKEKSLAKTTFFCRAVSKMPLLRYLLRSFEL